MLNSTTSRVALGAAVATAAVATIAAFFMPADKQAATAPALPPPPRRLPKPKLIAVAAPIPVVTPVPVVIPLQSTPRAATKPRSTRATRLAANVPAPGDLSPAEWKRRDAAVERRIAKQCNTAPTRERKPCFIVTVACDETLDDKKLIHRHTFKVRTFIEGEARQIANDTARRFAERFATTPTPEGIKSRVVSAGRVDTCGLFTHKARKLPRMPGGFAGSADSYNERHAIQYAEWLAARDRIAIPKNRDGHVPSGAAIWSGVTLRATGRYQRRVRAIRFGNVEIAIPNWDFEPSPATEESLPQALAA